MKRCFFSIRFLHRFLDVFWFDFGSFWEAFGRLWGVQIGHFWHRFFDDFCMSFQDRPKSGQEQPKSAQEPPKSLPRAPKSGPRGAQERPKSAQESPKSAQEAPKRGPRPSKREARSFQEGSEVRPKRHSGEILKKPQFFQLDPMALRYTGGPRKQQKIDKTRPRRAKKSIKIAKLRARGPR